MAFRGFTESIQVNVGIVRHIRPRKYRTTSFEINYSSIHPRRCGGGGVMNRKYTAIPYLHILSNSLFPSLSKQTPESSSI
jgi:hypothetical protein